jgi:peptidyl-prolyl cis-trans isomerase C
VVPSPYGFHLFKVTERKGAQKRSLEQARAEITEKLGREQRAAAQAEYVRTLRGRAKIQIDEKVLATVTP